LLLETRPMVRTPHSLKEAKEIVHEERVKVTSSLSAIAGSRWLMAILATFAITFGAHLLYAPDRLPPVGGISLTTLGLPSGVDFGVIGEQAREAAAAAQRQSATSRVDQFIAANEARIPVWNAVGFGVALLLLLGNMWIMTARRRFTRG
jgi:hypothetical protein